MGRPSILDHFKKNYIIILDYIKTCVCKAHRSTRELAFSSIKFTALIANSANNLLFEPKR
jgi:hypothetical protein